jgi:D-alanyl-D-alanine carboxypeptidase
MVAVREVVTESRVSAMAAKVSAAGEIALRKGGGHGAAIALSMDGNLVLSTGIGWRDYHHSIHFGPDRPSYLWSITKTFYAVAALQAAEQGLLSLDDPATQYLSGLELDSKVTIRRLLNHTAGIPDYGDLPEYHAAVRSSPGQPWTTAEFLAKTMGTRGLSFVPGSRWAYSNIGYLILRQMIERIYTRPMATFLESSIFAPLGLAQTRLAETREDAGDLFPGWSTIFGPDDNPVDVSHNYHPGWVSHGTAVGSAGELATIFDQIFTGGLVSRASLEAMLDPVIVPGDHWLFQEKAYGLGLLVDRRSPLGVIAGHTGEGPGYSTAVLHFSDLGGPTVTAVALANSDSVDLGLKVAAAMSAAIADIIRSGR